MKLNSTLTCCYKKRLQPAVSRGSCVGSLKAANDFHRNTADLLLQVSRFPQLLLCGCYQLLWFDWVLLLHLLSTSHPLTGHKWKTPKDLLMIGYDICFQMSNSFFNVKLNVMICPLTVSGSIIDYYYLKTLIFVIMLFCIVTCSFRYLNHKNYSHKLLPGNLHVLIWNNTTNYGGNHSASNSVWSVR